MNKLLPIAVLVIAGAALIFFIATQTPVSNYLPFVNNSDISPVQPSSSVPSNEIPTVDSSTPSSSSSGGSGSSGSSSSSSDNSDSEEEKAPNYCSTESREVEYCDVPSHIVCGWYSVEVTCPIGPCVRMFGNECEACRDQSIEYWTEGECPIHG